MTLRAKGFLKSTFGFTVTELTPHTNTLDRLETSEYGSDEHVKQISERFDDSAKRTFRGTEESCFISFGSANDKDVTHGIRSGRLKLTS